MARTTNSPIDRLCCLVAAIAISATVFTGARRALSAESKLVVQQQKLLSELGSTRATRYYPTNKIVTLNGRTHVAWLDSISIASVNTYDHRSGQWEGSIQVGQARDNHADPALTCDRGGFLHIIFGGHVPGQPLQHFRSMRPNDTSRWMKVSQLGLRPTYPSLVCDDQNTLHLIYRGETPSNKASQLLYQKLPARGPWTQPLILAVPPAKSTYAHYHASLAIDQKNRLHVAYDIYYDRTCREAGYMTSADRGRTWKSAAGKRINLPVTIESGPFFKQRKTGTVRVQNMTCDSQGHPWICMSALSDGSGPQLYHHDGKQWESFFPAKRVTPEVSPREFSGYVASLTLDRTDRVYVATVRSGLSRGEAAVLCSSDRGKSFQVLSAFPPESRLPHSGMNMERPTGQHEVDVPWFLFSSGLSGSDTHGKGIFHKVRAIQLGFESP